MNRHTNCITSLKNHCIPLVPPHCFSSPIFPSLTCLFRFAPSTIVSSLNTLSINPSRSCQKSFSPPCTCQPLEHMHLLCLISTLLSPVSWQLDCLTLSSPPRHFQPAPLSPLSLSHFFIHQLHCRIVCSHFQCSLLYSLSILFSVGTVHLYSFAPSCLPAFSPFQSLFCI